jgi:hypothetical protein
MNGKRDKWTSPLCPEEWRPIEFVISKRLRLVALRLQKGKKYRDTGYLSTNAIVL